MLVRRRTGGISVLRRFWPQTTGMYRLAMCGLLFCPSTCIFAQGSSLTLDSGSSVKGGSVSLNLSLTGGNGGAPAGLQWTLAYPSSDLSLSILPGPALTAANKTLTCAASTGQLTCVASGMNATTIGDGVVAVVTANVASSATGNSDSILFTNVLGAYPDATADHTSATGGIVTLLAPLATPVITSATSASITAGTTFSYQITATNSPTDYAATGLPAGLSVNTTTGLISGTPTAAGTSAVTLSAKNSSGTGSAILTLTIVQPSNPSPTLSTLSPASAVAGNAAFSLSVSGAGFVNSSVVYWNGSSRPTTFWNPTQLTAAITAADLAVPGTAEVTVFNPAPGGGVSPALAFTINAPNQSNCSFALATGSASLSATGTATDGVNFNGNILNGVLPESPMSVAILPSADASCLGIYTVTSSASWLSAAAESSALSVIALTNPNSLGRAATLTVANPAGGSATFTVTEDGNPEPLLNRQVRALYQSVLSRDPDAAGFVFWTGTGSARLGQMLDSFLTSPEAFNSDIATMAACLAATGALPSYAQFRAAVVALRAGSQTAGGLLNSLIPSGYSAQNLYQNLLGRPPLASEIVAANAVGLTSWFQTLIAYPSDSTPVTAPDNEFMNTGIFNSAPDHSNAIYIALLYYVILGRDLDQAGYTFWLGVANGGGPGILFQGAAGYATRIQILGPGTPPNQGFVGSPEFQGLYQAVPPANSPAAIN